LQRSTPACGRLHVSARDRSTCQGAASIGARPADYRCRRSRDPPWATLRRTLRRLNRTSLDSRQYRPIGHWSCGGVKPFRPFLDPGTGTNARNARSAHACQPSTSQTCCGPAMLLSMTACPPVEAPIPYRAMRSARSLHRFLVPVLSLVSMAALRVPPAAGADASHEIEARITIDGGSTRRAGA
jgi:hypothetical protein